MKEERRQQKEKMKALSEREKTAMNSNSASFEFGLMKLKRESE